MSIKITVEDTDNGDTESSEIVDDYVLICAGSHYLDGVVRHANGTVILTVKRATDANQQAPDHD